MNPLPTPRVGVRWRRRNISNSGLVESWSSLSSSFSVSSTCGWVVSMLTTAGSTRRAISANDADNASGARAICTSGWATVGRPESIAPMPMPASKQATASAPIQMRSFRRIVRSCSVVLFLETSNIFHHLLQNRDAQGKGQSIAKGLAGSKKLRLRAQKHLENAARGGATHRVNAVRERIFFADEAIDIDRLFL